jgi:hypothetical protein
MIAPIMGRSALDGNDYLSFVGSASDTGKETAAAERAIREMPVSDSPRPGRRREAPGRQSKFR